MCLLTFGLMQSLGNCDFDYLNFKYYLNTASSFEAEMWPIIETRFEGCPALLCLLTSGLITS